MANPVFPTNKVKELAAVVWRRKLTVVLALVTLCAVSLLVKDSLPYEAVANVLLVSNSKVDGDAAAQTDLPTIATGSVVIDRVRRSLNLPLTRFQIKHGLTAKVPFARSDVLQIKFKDKDPVEAAAVANSVADELAKYFREVSAGRYDENIRVLDSAIAAQRRRLNVIDRRLRARAGQGGFVPTDEHAMDDLASRLGEMEASRANASAALSGDVAQLNEVYGDGKTPAAVARYEILQNDVLYGNLLKGAASDAAQLAFDRAKFTGANPILPGLRDRVDQETAAVKAETARALADSGAFSPSRATFTIEAHKAEALVDGDRAKVDALDGAIARMRSQLGGLPEVQLLRLERDAAQADYLSLAARRVAVFGDRANALTLGTVVVIDRAVSDDPTLNISDSRLFLLFVMIAGVAIGCAFLAESLDTRLRNSAKIELLYGTPVVATISARI
jgi:uncharacterized protein involved in exopolysaccharide biosynthesis